MKIIEKENIIYLDNYEFIIIENKQKEKYIVECHNGTLIIDELQNREKFFTNTNQQLLQNFLKKNPTNIQIRTLFRNTHSIKLTADEKMII